MSDIEENGMPRGIIRPFYATGLRFLLLRNPREISRPRDKRPSRPRNHMVRTIGKYRAGHKAPRLRRQATAVSGFNRST